MKQIHKVISEDLDNQINKKIKEIEEFFGIKISYIDASKIISWKSKRTNIQLTSDKLLEILGGKHIKNVKSKK
jgi:hypothetical protein